MILVRSSLVGVPVPLRSFIQPRGSNMGKYNRIMVAVDGSETSLHALQESFKLADNWVTVVAVTPFHEGDLRLLGMPKSGRLVREPCDTALARAQELATAAG